MNWQQDARPLVTVLAREGGSLPVSGESEQSQIAERVINPAVSVVVLNWNGWQDTLECLDSLRCLGKVDLQIIVVDNGSTDGSCDRITVWARAEPPVQLGAPLAETNSEAVESQNETVDGTSVLVNILGFVLLRSPTNRGYAGGNNVGIRWALANTECKYVWILNNDCVVEASSRSAMVKIMEADPQAETCGATIRSYYDKNKTLMHGGAWLSHITFHSTPVILGPGERTQAAIRNRLSYVSGACMLIRRNLLEEIGLFSERYFLFFEEPDLMERAGGNCRLAVAFDAIVYHKEGSATGSVSATRRKSASADYYSFRSRLIFVSTYYPRRLWLVLLEVPVYVLARVLVGKPGNARAVLAAVGSFLRGETQAGARGAAL